MKKTIVSCLISISICLILVLLNLAPFYQILELKLYDLRMVLNKPPAQSEKIVFVEMDEQAMNRAFDRESGFDTD